MESRLPKTSPADLASNNNPCRVDQETLDAAVKKLARPPEISFEFAGTGIVAQCGGQSLVLRVPSARLVDMDRLEQAYPRIARLWKLHEQILEVAFGSENLFWDSKRKNNLSHQDDGERLIPQLRSGRYDDGLAAARKAGTGNPADSSFRRILEHYRGPVTQEDVEKRPVPRLLDAGAYRFTRFAAPEYPMLAIQGRVEGKVKLRLTVDGVTGEVRGASAVSGHPLLCPSAEEAARLWRLEPGSARSGGVEVTLEYALWD